MRAAGALLPLLWLSFVLPVMAAGAPASVGEVVFVQSIATAQQPGQPPRFLQKGEALLEGDVINTGGQGFAVISFKDGTQMTLRQNTTFAVDKYRHDAGEESALFRVVKGGIRALTGAISKRNPGGVEVNMVTATIGIRGTQFDARQCDSTDCPQDEARSSKNAAAAPAETIVARVAVVSGNAVAVGPAKEATPRALVVGTQLFNGDTIRTQKESYVVLGFRDQSKITVIADSEFKLEDVRFSGANSDTGNFAVRIVRGGIRALTGLLAKRDAKAISFRTTTAVIGLRGSGGDIVVDMPFCISPQDCSPGVHVSVWEGGPFEMVAGGKILLITDGQTGVFVPVRDFLQLGNAFTLPEPRPDSIQIPFEKFFTKDTVTRGPYVAVDDGRVVFCAAGGGQCAEVGIGEAFQLKPGLDSPTPIQFPTGMRDLPQPGSFDPRAFRVLERLNPGGLICEM